MENGLRRSRCLWDGETQELSQAVSISSGCAASEKKKKTSDAASHVCFSPGRRDEMARRQRRRCVQGAPVITAEAAPLPKDGDTGVPLQICICLTLGPARPAPAFIYCSPARDTGKPLNWFVCFS